MTTEKTNIYKKLLVFQKLDISVIKDGKNDYYKKDGKASTYCTLNEVLDKVKKPLNDLGILLIFAPESEGLRTILIDTESETKVEGFMKYIGVEKAQSLLACNTYFRRGSLVSLLGLEDEDDDGNAASGVNQKQENKTITSTKIEVKKETVTPEVKKVVIKKPLMGEKPYLQAIGKIMKGTVISIEALEKVYELTADQKKKITETIEKYKQ